jgi:iron only hydrogenase large subunit-like protein
MRSVLDVNQRLKTRTFSVPKNPEFEHVILNSIQNLLDDWRCQHQKDSASVANVVRLVRNDLSRDFSGREEQMFAVKAQPLIRILG